ncbi:MFS monocarboxylate transporter [Rhodotorula toruloides]|uniref:MFS monocarboxylate transporter n=1 Tax=Rhodotorula toruloides TaxID=5286 RepID=A0A2T0A2J4_RHOTO|nr:MFS monocarboxylate transporter [Rhodotorula toruloides]
MSSAVTATAVHEEPALPTEDLPSSPETSRVSTFDFGDGEDNAKALPPVDGGRHAWQFVVASFMLECFGASWQSFFPQNRFDDPQSCSSTRLTSAASPVWGYSFAFATILVYLQSHDPWRQYSLSALSAIGTTQLGLMYCLPIVGVVIFRRYGDWVRTILWTSVAVSCGSMLLSSWATKLWQLVVLQGVLCGIANTFIFAPVFCYISEWWVARRGLAWGLIVSGNGFGGFTLPWLINAVLQARGFAWMCRVWAIFTAVVFAISILLLKPRIPYVRPASGRAPWLAVDFTFLRNPLFVCMAIATLFSSLAYLPVANYLAVYASSFSSSVTTINLVVGLFNLAACGGSMLAGRVSDFSYSLGVTVIGVCGALLSLTAWGFADTLAKVYAFAVLFGLTGQQTSTWGGVVNDLASNNPNTGTFIFTILPIVRGSASLFIPFILQALYSRETAEHQRSFGRYGFLRMIILVGVASATLALCGIVMAGLRRRFAVKSS